MRQEKRYRLELRGSSVNNIDASEVPESREFDSIEDAEAELQRLGPDKWQIRDTLEDTAAEEPAA